MACDGGRRMPDRSDRRPDAVAHPPDADERIDRRALSGARPNGERKPSDPTGRARGRAVSAKKTLAKPRFLAYVYVSIRANAARRPPSGAAPVRVNGPERAQTSEPLVLFGWGGAPHNQVLSEWKEIILVHILLSDAARRVRRHVPPGGLKSVKRGQASWVRSVGRKYGNAPRCAR